VQDHSTAPTGRLSGWRTVLLAVVAFVAAFWLLRETMAITMPLVTALLLALGVWPMVAGISRRMPRGLKWLGPAAGLLLVLALVGAFLAALGLAARQAYELVGDIGPAVQRWLASFGVQAPSWEDVEGENGSLAATLRRALGLTASTITGIVLILFLMLLMLTEVENWHRKFIAISPGNSDRSLRETGRSVGEKFRTYFTTRILLGSITAILYVGWLALFGVDYLLLWGLLAVLLNFIPTVGSIVAGLLPVAYALVTKDPGTAAIVAGGLLVIEQVMGNFVDPLVLGRRIAVSPLVILVSLGFWTLVWGIPGAILAVPFTVLAILSMAHFEALKPAALLLTDRSSFDELEEFRHTR
jgi:AI-2 transport protein TqsA